jgi:hypothetical protein
MGDLACLISVGIWCRIPCVNALYFVARFALILATLFGSVFLLGVV